MAKRKPRFKNLKVLFIAGFLFVAGSLYLAFSRGTGPFSTLLTQNMASINVVGSCSGLGENECVAAGCNWRDGYTDSTSTRTVACSTTDCNKPKDGCGWVTNQTNGCSYSGIRNRNMCIAEGGDWGPTGATTRTCVGTYKEGGEEFEVPGKCSGTPAAPVVPPADPNPPAPIVSDTCLVTGANVPIKPGFTYATGYGWEDNSRCSTTECSQRECVSYGTGTDNCKVAWKGACGDAYAQNPTTTILPSGGGASQYTTTSSGTKINAPAPCLTATGPVPTGQMTDTGICFNGTPYTKDSDQYKKAISDFNCGDGAVFNLSKFICEEATTQVITEIDAGIMKLKCDNAGKYYIESTNSCGNTLPAFTPPKLSPQTCTDPTRVTRNNICASITCSTPGKNSSSCLEGEICVQPQIGNSAMYCVRANTITTENGATTCTNNVQSTWSSELAKYDNKYCPLGCNGNKCADKPPSTTTENTYPGSTQCKANLPSGLDCVPIPGTSNFTRVPKVTSTTEQVSNKCEGKDLVLYRGNQVLTRRNCGDVGCNSSENKCNSPSTNYPNAGKECDRSMASKDTNGNYTSTPSCGQLCGGLGSRLENGKTVCNAPPAAQPAEPATPAQPATPTKDYPNVGKECDRSMASKDTNGNYTSTPSCGQLCGGLGSRLENGKTVCNAPPAAQPAEPAQPGSNTTPNQVDNSIPVRYSDKNCGGECKGLAPYCVPLWGSSNKYVCSSVPSQGSTTGGLNRSCKTTDDCDTGMFCKDPVVGGKSCRPMDEALEPDSSCNLLGSSDKSGNFARGCAYCPYGYEDGKCNPAPAGASQESEDTTLNTGTFSRFNLSSDAKNTTAESNALKNNTKNECLPTDPKTYQSQTETCSFDGTRYVKRALTAVVIPNTNTQQGNNFAVDPDFRVFMQNGALRNVSINQGNINTPFDTSMGTSGCGPATLLNILRLENIIPRSLSDELALNEILTASNFYISCTEYGCASGADSILAVLENKYGYEGAYTNMEQNRFTNTNDLTSTNGTFVYQGDVRDENVVTRFGDSFGHNAVITCNDGNCQAIDSYTGMGQPQPCEIIDENNLKCGTSTYLFSEESRNVGVPPSAYLLPGANP